MQEFVHRRVQYLSISQTKASGKLSPVRLGDVLLYLEAFLQTFPLEVGEHRPGPGLLTLAAAESEAG